MPTSRGGRRSPESKNPGVVQCRRDTREHVVLYLRAFYAWAADEPLTSLRYTTAREPAPTIAGIGSRVRAVRLVWTVLWITHMCGGVRVSVRPVTISGPDDDELERDSTSHEVAGEQPPLACAARPPEQTADRDETELAPVEPCGLPRG